MKKIILLTIFGMVLLTGQCFAAEYSLNITSNNGTVVKTPDKQSYQSGEIVKLIAFPDIGYYFNGWTGNALSNRHTLKVRMDRNMNITAAFPDWIVPIGIPQPEFGIFEKHTMYNGKTYDFGSGQEPYKNAGNGPYTHYIDFTHSNSTDTDNPFGTPDKPRRQLPQVVLAGSVVEIHGGPYAGGNSPYKAYRVEVIANGTAAKPVFIRGANRNDMPLFNWDGPDQQHRYMQLKIGGQYFIVENLELTNTRIQSHDDVNRNHAAYRNLLIHGSRKNTTGALIYTGGASDMVVYNNYIHDNGNVLAEYDPLLAAVNVTSDSNRIFILDNHIHHTGADAVHSGHRGYNIEHVYVGRNEMHHDGENAIDIKTVNNVIISQNIIYGYKDFPSTGGAIRINDEEWDGQTNVWIIFNEISASLTAIDAYESIATPYIIGNKIYDCNNAIRGDGGGSEFDYNAVNNVIFDVKRGVSGANYFVNNIISKASDYHIHEAIDVRNNLLYQNGNSVVVEDATLVDCLIQDPQFTNVNDFSTELSFYEYHIGTAEVIQSGNETKIRVAGVNFEEMGVRVDDRISVEKIPEILYDPENPEINPGGCAPGRSSSRPLADILRISEVNNDTLTLRLNVARAGAHVSNVDISIWYYPYYNQHSIIYINSDSRYQTGDIIEYNYDGIPRVITQIQRGVESDSRGNLKDAIEFQPALNENVKDITVPVVISNWKNNSNISRNFSLKPSSPGINGGTDVGIAENIYDKFFSLYNINIQCDILGVSRPRESEWDIGAYEYTDSSTAPQTPTGLKLLKAE